MQMENGNEYPDYNRYENKMFEFHEKLVFLYGDKKTMLAHTHNAKVLFIPNQCVEILKDAVRLHFTFANVVEELSDDSDKTYFKKIFSKLIENEMIFIEGNSFNIKPIEIKISVDISNNCNLKCSHCCVSAGEHLRGKDIDTEQMKKVLDQVIRVNPRTICISGGEPLFRNDFEELISYISDRYHGGLLLMTNAVLINDDLAKFISDHFNQVDVSIDGVDEESCSILRGKGIFDQIIRGIKLLQKFEVNNIIASMVLSENNKNNQESFETLCKTLGIKSICRGYDEIGRGFDNLASLSPNKIENKELSEEQLDRLRKRGFTKSKPTIFTCGGCDREIQIDHKGGIFPCGLFLEEEFKMGNILEIDDLSAFILERKFVNTDGYKNFSRFFPQNTKICGECNKSVLCWTCAGDLREHIEKKLFPNCKENQSAFSLYWE